MNNHGIITLLQTLLWPRTKSLGMRLRKTLPLRRMLKNLMEIIPTMPLLLPSQMQQLGSEYSANGPRQDVSVSITQLFLVNGLVTYGLLTGFSLSEAADQMRGGATDMQEDRKSTR